MYEINIMKEFENLNGYESVLMTSFNFEIQFFERYILNKLYNKNIKKISLFIDKNEFVKDFNKTVPKYLGRKYVVNLIECKSAFHPKMILFIGKNKAKLILGSGNIKLSGICFNYEVFNVYEYNPKNKNNLNIIQKAVEIFNNINSISYNLDTQLIKEINSKSYLYEKSDINQTFLLDNYKQSILEQICDIINKQKVKEIHIAVPYYDEKLEALEEIKKQFNTNNILLYIQNKTSTFPIQYNKTNNVIPLNKINLFNTFKSNNSSKFYHGKVFLIKTENKDFVLYGSSNCTKAALTKSFINGGNFESNFVEIGEKNEFDYFFEDMEKINWEEEFSSEKMNYYEKNSYSYDFKYATLNNNVLMCVLYCKDDKNIKKVYVNKVESNYEYNKNEIIITTLVDENFQANLKLDIQIESDLDNTILSGWYINYNDINYNRNLNRQEEKSIYNIKDFKGDSLDNYYILMNTMNMTFEEAGEHKMIIDRIMDEEENGAEFEDEEYIVNINLENNQNAYKIKEQETLNKILKINIFEPLRLKLFRSLNVDKDKQENEYESKKIVNKQPRKSTSAERRFFRYFKNRIRYITEPNYINIVDIEQYFQNYEIILKVFDKFKAEEKIEDIFRPEYILETILQLIKILINKEDYMELGKEKRDIVKVTLFILIIIIKEIDNSKYNSQKSIILNMYDKIDYIRDDYEYYLTRAVDYCNTYLLKDKKLQNTFEIGIIENLFQYKSEKAFKKYLENKLKNVEFIETENQIILVTYKERLNNFNKYNDTELFKEIKKYYNNQNARKDIIVSYRKIKPTMENMPKELMRIDFKIYAESYMINIIAVSKDGEVSMIKQ